MTTKKATKRAATTRAKRPVKKAKKPTGDGKLSQVDAAAQVLAKAKEPMN